MPISTPEPRQKACRYCNTPAEMLATKCQSCGSSLPVAIPRPIAKVIEAQGKWSLKRTGIITSIISLVFGLLWAKQIWEPGPVAGLLLLWVMFIMPAMLLWSAIANARRKVGGVVLNVVIAIGLWWGGLLLAFVGTAL